MQSYRCLFLNSQFAIAGVEIIEAETDAEAVERAERVFAEKAARFNGYELWYGAWRVHQHATPVQLSLDDSPERIRWWRMKAEELRTGAEGFTNHSSRDYFQHAAETYEALANNAEARLQRRKDRKPEVA